MIVDFFAKLTQWLLDAFLYIPKKLWELLLDAFATVIEAIPVPEFINTAGNAFGSIPPNILFFANFFALGEGITMILSAYVLRFIIRRLPIIG